MSVATEIVYGFAAVVIGLFLYLTVGQFISIGNAAANTLTAANLTTKQSLEVINNGNLVLQSFPIVLAVCLVLAALATMWYLKRRSSY